MAHPHTSPVVAQFANKMNCKTVTITRKHGYSPCKILSLGQKIKLPKTCEKRFYKHVKVVLCKKRLEKTTNIGKMRAF